jgi:hypothetical protein
LCLTSGKFAAIIINEKIENKDGDYQEQLSVAPELSKRYLA